MQISNKQINFQFANFKNLLQIFICLFAYLLICLFSPLSASAQTTDNTNTIAVSPSIARIDLATDAPQYDLTYTNNTASTVELSLSASDFTALEDGYKLSFLDPKQAANYRYALSSWISFETTDITINPHESKNVTVYVNKNGLTTGGHYASIQAQWIQREGEGNVHVNAILSSLLFVRTAHGNEREEASLSTIDPAQNFLFFPDIVVLRFKNSGNVELVPHGLIQIKNIFGSIVADGIINDGSLITLPESVRRYDTFVTPETSFLLPGIYTIDGYIHYGEKNKIIPFHKMFFSIGSLQCVGVIIVLVVIAGIIFFRKSRVRNIK